MPHENKMQFLGRAIGAAEKISNQPRMLATSKSPLLPIHLLSSSTTVSVPSSIGYSAEKLRTLSIAHLFSTSKPP